MIKIVNLIKFAKCVTILRGCNWVFAFRNDGDPSDVDGDDGDNEMLDKTEVKLKNHVNKIFDESDCLNVDYQEANGLDDIKDIMKRHGVLKKLQTLLPSITNDINKLAHVIQSFVIDSLNKIGKMYSLPKNNKKRGQKKRRKKIR